MTDRSLGFIGGGNMSSAIIGGLLNSGIPASSVMVSEPFEAQRQRLLDDFGELFVSPNNGPVAARADVLLLGVKPQVLKSVCKEIRAEVQGKQPLVISVAAGVRVGDIDTWLGGGLAVVRCMPNQPALIGRGITGLFAGPACSDAQAAFATEILEATGQVITVASEDDIDTVTAVAGSGPAYVYLLMSLLEEYAVSKGIDPAAARRLAIETTAGAAELAARSDDPMQTLIERVRSPGGTTAAALDSLDASGVHDIFAAAFEAARVRAADLADQASES